MTYEQLLDSADQEGLAVKEVSLSTHDGLIRDKCIAIRKEFPIVKDTTPNITNSRLNNIP